MKLEASKSIREDYLHQNAFHDIDTYASLNKQYRMMKLILSYYDFSLEAIGKGASFNKLSELAVREAIGRFKYIEEEKIDDTYDEIIDQMRAEIDELLKKEAEDDD